MAKANIEKRCEKWRRSIIRMIEATRQDADISRKQLADALGWTDQRLANVLTGRTALMAEDMMMISEALRIEPAELVRRIQRW